MYNTCQLLCQPHTKAAVVVASSQACLFPNININSNLVSTERIATTVLTSDQRLQIHCLFKMANAIFTLENFKGTLQRSEQTHKLDAGYDFASSRCD
jgi:hypothetical protein